MNRIGLFVLGGAWLWGMASVLFSENSGNAASLSGNEIMAKSEEARQLNDIYSTATLRTGGGGSTERVKEFEWWKKLSSDKVHYKSLSRFHVPAEIKGEGILFIEQPKDDNEVLMYLPNFKKIRRVESQQQSQSFMGSEFSYSDMATPHTSEYEHKLLGEETCADVKCFVVESVPVSDLIKERTGYSKSVARVRSDNFMVVQAEYWNLEGELFKKMDAADIKLEDPVGKKWMARKLEIKNLKTGHFTKLSFNAVKVNKGVADATFTQHNLARVQ